MKNIQMIKSRFLIALIFLKVILLNNHLYSQSFYEEGRFHVDTLTRPYFWGRAYINNGVENAARYISNFYEKYNVLPFEGSYYQEFTIPHIVVFPDSVKLTIDNRALVAGRDFIVNGNSSGKHAYNVILTQSDSVTFSNDLEGIEIQVRDKLVFAPSQRQKKYTGIQLLRTAGIERFNDVSVEVNAEIIHDFKTHNVIGFIKGTKNTDSFLVITAHYDHVGGYGNQIFFPGANDNASGVAMLLTLMKYYSENPPEYNIAFMAFSGEELGLLGSFFYVDNPLFDLRKIRFLMNLDLVGNGTDGITVVNATEFPAQFQLLKSISEENSYLTRIVERGQAANSDHYPFFKMGVPCFFIYSQGGSDAYHDIYDTSENTMLTEFQDITQLVIDFFNEVIKL